MLTARRLVAAGFFGGAAGAVFAHQGDDEGAQGGEQNAEDGAHGEGGGLSGKGLADVDGENGRRDQND